MCLKKYFNYWDCFVDIWQQSFGSVNYQKEYENKIRNCKFTENHFSFPENIMNCSCKAKQTFEYLPEPYWGWTPNNGSKLEMVLINYNPFSGGEKQYFNNLENTSLVYSQYVKEQTDAFIKYRSKEVDSMPTQYNTSNWHFSRAKKLKNIIHSNCNEQFGCIKNYLGIELVPWHTKNISDIKTYLEKNNNAIKNLSLNFAIEASKSIPKYSPFRNKIIIKTSFTEFSKIFSNEYKIIKEINDEGLNLKKVELNGCRCVDFIVVWSKFSRSNLPNTDFIKDNL